MLPKIVQDENDPNILRAYMGVMSDFIGKQQKTIEQLQKKQAEKDQETIKIDDQLLVCKKMLFGKSSEKRSHTGRKRLDSKKQLSLHGDSLAPAPKSEEMEALPEVKVDHELSEMDLASIAEEYGYDRDSEWEHLTGLYDESEVVDVVVQSYIRKKHRRHKYRLKATKNSEKEVIVTAPNALKLIPGGKYSIELAVEVVASKYLYHLPLERIRRQMESAGLNVVCKTLYSLCFFVSCYLEDIVKNIRKEILYCGLALHIDETRWPINNKKQSDGYMWVMSNQAGSYYQFESTRSGKIAKELIGDYEGPIVTDGYGGYKSQFKKVNKIDLAFCWAHARRKFTDIEQNYPVDCGKVLDLIDELFAIEREAKDFEHLKDLRQERSKILVDKLRNLLFEMKPRARGDSGLEGAINYVFNHWGGLTLFLENIKIPLSNNEVERTIRHAVVGRKNFHGSRSINGADVAAYLYTIIESCKKVELDPKAYILMVVKKIIKKQNPLTPLEYARQIRSTPGKTA